MENLHVKFEGATGNEFVLRQGNALPPVPPEIVNIEGDINSVFAFLSKRPNGFSSQTVDQTKIIVLVDKKDLTIKLLLDPENKYGAKVTGKLELNDDLKPFEINTGKEFTRESLIKLIRFNRRFFASPEKHTELLQAYQLLNISSKADLKNESDNRGNKNLAFQKTVNSENIPTEFVLRMPIFKGFDDETFRVEICLEATDASVRFWFESVELHELMQTRRDEIFSKQLQSCSDFVIINK